MDPVAKPFRKSFQHDHYAYSSEQGNQSELIKSHKMDPVANPIRKILSPNF